MNLQRTLRRAVPSDPSARDRAWRVVAAAHAELPAVAPRRRWRGVAATGCAAAVAALGAAARAAPPSDIRPLLRSVLGFSPPNPPPPPLPVPGGGAPQRHRPLRAQRAGLLRHEPAARARPCAGRRPPARPRRDERVGRRARRLAPAPGHVRRRLLVAARAVRHRLAWDDADRADPD